MGMTKVGRPRWRDGSSGAGCFSYDNFGPYSCKINDKKIDLMLCFVLRVVVGVWQQAMLILYGPRMGNLSESGIAISSSQFV